MTVRKAVPRQTAEPKPLPIGQLKVTRTSELDPKTGRIAEYNLRINWPGGEQAEHIVHDVLPRVIELFLLKCKDYSREDGFNWAEVLGDKAQFVDLWRKTSKLYNGLWEDRTMGGEPVEEIVMDMIGHCLLILEMRTRATGYRQMSLDTDRIH